MKKIKLFDSTTLDIDLGFDNQTGWSIHSDVQSVEFEEGTILINENFNLESVKASKISVLESQIIELQIRKDASVKAGLSGVSLQSEIDALKAEIATIEAL